MTATPNMSSKIEVQLHLWPWSVDVSEEKVDLTAGDAVFPFYGSPLISVSSRASLFLPQRYERFIPFGPKFQTLGGEYCLYETPHGVMSARGEAASEQGGEILVRTEHFRETVRMFPKGARPRHVPKSEPAEFEETELVRIVLAWSQFFDDLIEETKESSRENKLPWVEIEKFILRISRDVAEPRMALIVDIAERMHGRLALVVNSARRILIRERSMLPAGRVAETDATCLQWFVRQPGDTMAHKASANRQRLLGVSRRESFDTLENRVLRDFLARCAREGHRYLDAEVGDDIKLQQSKRAQTVRGYRRLCSSLHRVPHLESVVEPPSMPRANYVLQNDYRYKKMWQHYLRLLRREDEEDRLWDWQARTWADVARLLVNFALFGLSQEEEGGKRGDVQFEEILTSVVHLLREQHLGSRVAAGSAPGPFIVNRRGADRRRARVLEIVHPDLAEEHLTTRGLGRLGGHLYLVLTSVLNGTRSVIVVWAVHTAAAERHPPWTDICSSAQRALQLHKAMLEATRERNVPDLHGFIVASDMETESADLYSDPEDRLHLIKVAVDQRCWEDALAGMKAVVEDILEAAL